MVLVATRSGSTSPRSSRPALDGADDLVDVDRLGVAVALAHLHRRTAAGCLRSVALLRLVVPAGLGDRHGSLLASRSGVRRTGGRATEGERCARRATLTSRRPSHAASDHRTPACTVRWQVFGLVGTTSARSRASTHLLAVASQTLSRPVLLTAVVPTHRCGAVPDLTPGSLLPRPAWIGGANQLQATPYTGPPTSLTTTCCGGVSRRPCRTASRPPVRGRLRRAGWPWSPRRSPATVGGSGQRRTDLLKARRP